MAHAHFRDNTIRFITIAVCFVISMILFRTSGADSFGFGIYQLVSGLLSSSQVRWIDGGYEDSNIEIVIDMLMLICTTAILYKTACFVMHKLRNMR